MIGESRMEMEMSMSGDEDYSKQKADSPALTEATSYTSSPESSPQDDFKNSSIRRTLFKINRDGDSPKETIDSPSGSPSTSPVGRGAVLTPSGGENGLADTTSITSSETTAIPSWNLSMKDVTEKNVEVQLNHFVLSRPVPLLSSPPTFLLHQIKPILSSPSSFASDESLLSNESQPQLLVDETVPYSLNKSDNKENVRVRIEKTRKPSVVMEDPPEEPTSCNAALNLAPGQLVEIVFAFGQSARQRYQGSEQTGKAPTNSNPKTPSSNKAVEPTRGDSLIGSPPPIMTSRHLSESSSSQSDKSQSSFVRSIERERNTLTITTKRDALTISNLRHAIDTQKQLNSLKEVEIVDKQAELQISEHQILIFQKEHEDYLERETELVETIKILKKELDKMTSLQTVPSDELDHLILESEQSANKLETDNFSKETKLAESLAKEQQARIVELKRSLKEKEQGNFDLQTKIDWLKNRHKEEGKNEQDRKASEKAKLENVDGHGVSEDERIESRLKDIMKRLEAVEIEKNEKEYELTAKSKEDSEETKSVPKYQKIELGHNGVKINVSDDPDAIEAMTLKGRKEKVLDSGNQSTWCCDWNLISEE
jgi:hypothetical protein